MNAVNEATSREAPRPSGEEFGSYEIIRTVGVGASSYVYEAVHNGLQKRVAIKVLFRELAARDEVRARFISEGKACSRIHHPHVVDVTDVGTVGDVPYLVMEYLEGRTFEALLDEEGQLSIGRALNILLPVMAAVQAGHDHGVVHRDLKPDNVYLAMDGLQRVIPKVLDFGVSKLDNDSAQGAGQEPTILGTPHYMSPEQARGEPDLDASTDQYSLGVMLYESVTGRLPRDHESVLELIRQVAYGAFPRPREICPEISGELEGIILTAMSPRREERFPSVRAFGEALLPMSRPRARSYWESYFSDQDEIPPGQEGPLRASTETLSVYPEALYPETPYPDNPRAGSGVHRAAPPRNRSSDRPTLAESEVDTDVEGRDGQSSDAASNAAANGSRFGRSKGASPLSNSAETSWFGRWQETGKSWKWAIFLALAFVMLFGVWSVLEDSPAGATTVSGSAGSGFTTSDRGRFWVQVDAQPPSARFELDGELVGQGSYSERFARDGRVRRLVVRAEGFRTRVIRFRDEPPPSRIVLQPAATAAKAANVSPANISPGRSARSADAETLHAERRKTVRRAIAKRVAARQRRQAARARKIQRTQGQRVPGRNGADRASPASRTVAPAETPSAVTAPATGPATTPHEAGPSDNKQPWKSPSTEKRDSWPARPDITDNRNPWH